MLTSFPTLKVGLLIVVIIIAIAIISDIFITDLNVQKFIAFGTMAGAIGAIIALIFVMQEANQLKKSVGIQLNSFNLDQRPYLYAYLREKIDRNHADGYFYGAGNLCFENRGKVPADFILSETKYIIASNELGKIDNEGWFNEKAGGYPHVKVVFPGQKGLYVPMHPRIGKMPNIIYVGAVIKYKGTDPQRNYWYKFSQIFYMSYKEEKDDKGRSITRVSLAKSVADHSWDMNLNSTPPELNIPEWEKLKRIADYYLKEKAEVIVENQKE